MSEKPQGLEPLVIVDNFGQKFFGVSQAEQLMPGNPDSALTILETDSLRQIEAKYMLMGGYLYAGKVDSALNIETELIDYARRHKLGDWDFQCTIERTQLLSESGRENESDSLINKIFSMAGEDNGAADQLNFQRAINDLNRGDVARAAHHLAIADSLAYKMRGDDDAYFRSYSNMLHAVIDVKRTGRIKLMQIAGLNNRMNERFNRMKASQWESERGALAQQNRALELKAESRQKTVIILIIGIAAILILGCSETGSEKLFVRTVGDAHPPVSLQHHPRPIPWHRCRQLRKITLLNLMI